MCAFQPDNYQKKSKEEVKKSGRFGAGAPGPEAKEVDQDPTMKYQAKVLIHTLKETNSVCVLLFCFEALM